VTQNLDLGTSQSSGVERSDLAHISNLIVSTAEAFAASQNQILGRVGYMATFSVIIANYNDSAYLPDNLNSILSQSRLPDEILIIDDGSTDNSIELIEEYQKKHPLIRLVRHEKNLGVIATVREGVLLAKGEFVAIVSADDLLVEGFCEQMFAHCSNHPEIGICLSNSYYFFEFDFDKRVKHELLSERELQRFFSDTTSPKTIPPEVLSSILKKTFFHLSDTGVVYKRASILRFGGFDPDLECYCDTFLNWQIAFRESVGYVPTAFSAQRRRSRSYSTTRLSDQKRRESIFSRLLDRIVREKDLYQKLLDTGHLWVIGNPLWKYLLKHPTKWHLLSGYFKRYLVRFWRLVESGRVLDAGKRRISRIWRWAQ